jgi:hypothetical protein
LYVVPVSPVTTTHGQIRMVASASLGQ